MTTTEPAGPSAASMADAAVAAPAGGVPVARSRRVRLTVVRVDPWTVVRLSFLLSVAVAVITVVAVLLLWGLLEGGGVFGTIERSANDILGDGSVTFTQYFDLGKVLWVSIVLAAADVVLITALATLGAFLFNLAASLSGGLELSVTEDG